MTRKKQIKIIPEIVKIGYCRCEFGNYLGIIGKITFMITRPSRDAPNTPAKRREDGAWLPVQATD